MDQIVLLEAVERYLRGEMNDRRKAILRGVCVKTILNSTRWWLNIISSWKKWTAMERSKRFKANLYDTHHSLQENGDIKEVNANRNRQNCIPVEPLPQSSCCCRIHCRYYRIAY